MYHYMNYDFTALDVQWTEILDFLLFSGEDLFFVRAHFVRAFVFFYLMFVLNLHIFRSEYFIWLLLIYLLHDSICYSQNVQNKVDLQRVLAKASEIR